MPPQRPRLLVKSLGHPISEENLVPVGEGISFVSRVQTVQVVDTPDVLAYLKETRHPNPEEAAKIIRKCQREPEVLLMRLGEPRLMFVSPVMKTKLAKKLRFGVGAMGSRSCTFDDLLFASQ